MKSHYRRSEFAPNIVVNKLSQGFNVFILGRSKYGWSLNKGSHIRCSEREAAAFPFALNTMNSLTRVTLVIRISKSRPEYSEKGRPFATAEQERAVLTANPKLQTKTLPATASDAAVFSLSKRHTASSTCACVACCGVITNGIRRETIEKEADFVPAAMCCVGAYAAANDGVGVRPVVL